MQKRMHAKICMLHASVPLGRLLPGRSRGRDRSHACSPRACAQWHAACALLVIYNLSCAHAMQALQYLLGSVPRFPGMAEIGHSQKARHRTPAHAMMHENERPCVEKHGRHMNHAILHAHAHAACDPIPASGVSTDTFSSANDEGITRSVSSTAPASINVHLQAEDPGCNGGHCHAQMHLNKRMLYQGALRAERSAN